MPTNLLKLKIYLTAIMCLLLTPGSIRWNMLAAQGLPRAEVKSHNGTPALFINGEPNAGFAYMTYNFKPRHFRQFGEIGVDLASFSTTCDFSFYFAMPEVWKSPGVYDYSDVDYRFNTIVEANPNAYIFPRIYVCTPAWWDSLHPEEMVVFDGGVTETVYTPPSINPHKVSIPSFSSKKWQTAAADNLRRFVAHVRSQPYAKNIIGYHIASASTEEWFYWNSNSGMVSDFSRPQIAAFREWLRGKYDTEEKLKRMWDDANASFESALIPTAAERKAGDYFLFRDASKNRKIIDYMEFHSWAVQNMIAILAKAVKEACNYESLVGTFYGYVLHTSGTDNFQERGHLALTELLKSPDIDFLTSPTLYSYREPGTGYSVFMSPQASIQLHDKLWMDENDYRTHLLPWSANYGRTENFDDSEAAQLRQLANEITHAAGAWWFDMGGGWYDTPQMMNMIKRLNAVGERSIHFDRSSSAEIAVVMDEFSGFMTAMDNRLSKPMIVDQALPIGRIGAPVDYILMNDLERARPYKLYIFLNAFHVTDEQKVMIGNLGSRGARAFLWIYAPGFCGDSLDVRGCEELTGIHIAFKETECPLQVKITTSGVEKLPGTNAGEIYGTTNTIGPVLYADDPEAEILGVLYGHGKPGLVMKKIDGMQIYYSSAPLLSSSVLRGIAASAGVHIYNFRDDVLYGNESFIAVHTADSGVRTLKFPVRTSLYDVYGEKEIARDISEIAIDMPVRKTFLYFMGTKEEWEGR